MIANGKIFCATGMVLFILAGITVIPAAVDLYLARNTASCFIVSGIFCCFLGGLMFLPNRAETATATGPREKILIVLLSWIIVPIIAALPFVLSSDIDFSTLDCIFEVMSALTTTGATIVADISRLSEGLLLWRSLLQLFGAVGFIISCLCVFSDFTVPGATEDMGRPGNMFPSRRMKIALLSYPAAVIVGSFLLTGSGISPTDSLCCALDALSGGGILISDVNFSARSEAALPILSLLMFMGGMPLMAPGTSGSAGFHLFKDRQFICYIAIVGVGVAALFARMLYFSDISAGESLKTAMAAVISALTTTGMKVRLAESFSPFIDSCLYVSSFCGGCYGSCTGGVKILRLMVMFSLIRGYLIRLTKPNAFFIPACGGRQTGEKDATGLLSYFMCCLMFALVMSLSLTAAPGFDFGKAFGAVMTSINSNGPFFGLHRATAAEIIELPGFVKAVLIASMAAGRIEFISFLVILIRPFWKK
jgi:trk system potassium uptake protein TrkH